MKKLIIVVLCIGYSSTNFACDICGCSSGNYFLGAMPQFNKYFFGLRYSYRGSNTVLNNTDGTQFSRDTYQTTELWGGFKIRRKFQVLAFVPFNKNHSVTDDGFINNTGLGDITLMGSYNLFNNLTLNKDSQTVSQQLWVSGGAKLPTGMFKIDPTSLIESANRQLGTGSVDFLLTAMYTLQVAKWGLSSSLTYKINQAASGFQYGNRLAATAFVSHSFRFCKSSFSPSVGLLFEDLSPNQLYKTNVPSTGGYDLLASAGLETRFNKVMVGFNAQYPLMQNISDGQTKINLRGMLHVTYAF